MSTGQNMPESKATSDAGRHKTNDIKDCYDTTDTASGRTRHGSSFPPVNAMQEETNCCPRKAGLGSGSVVPFPARLEDWSQNLRELLVSLNRDLWRPMRETAR